MEDLEGLTGAMASADGELEKQLMEAGNKLLPPPVSVDELLPLLDVSPNPFGLYGFFVWCGGVPLARQWFMIGGISCFSFFYLADNLSCSGFPYL